MDLENDELSWRCWLRTTLAGTGAMILFSFYGLYEAQTATMLPQLQKADSLIPVTPDEETWIASIGMTVTPVSAIVSGPFIDVFGRKRGLQTFYFITAFGYAVIACAKDVYQIYIGRTLCGLATGQVACSVVYLAEISTPKQREYFFAITTGMIAVGVMLSNIIGGYLPWYVASFIYSVAAFVLFVADCCIPESPPWLFRMGREVAAIRSLQKLGRTETQARRESDAFKAHCKDDPEDFDWSIFFEPIVWKPFIIMVILFFFCAASGIRALFFYSVDFVQRLGTSYDPLAVTVMLSITRLVTSLTISVFFRSKVKRKTALALSSFGMTVGLVSVLAYNYVNRDVDVSERPFQWLPIVSVCLYVATCVLGMLGLPTVMNGEVFPLQVRGTMSSMVFGIGCAFFFVFVKIYYILIDALQFDGLLLTFAGFNFLAIFFAIYILPETQNKSLLEIQRGFFQK